MSKHCMARAARGLIFAAIVGAAGAAAAAKVGGGGDVEFDIQDGVLRRTKPNGAENIVVPEDVRRTEYGSFWGADRIREVRLPAGLEILGARTFENCYSLERVFIPASVRKIGPGAFNGCRRLSRLDIQSGSKFEFKDGILFDKEDRVVLFALPGIERAVFPEAVREIGQDAFARCERLEEASIPEGVTKIGRSAFLGCKSLSVLRLPASLENMEDSAISGCPALERIEIPAGGRYSVSGNTLLGDGGRTIVRGFGRVEEIRVPDGITRIAPNAFSSSAALKKAFVPDTVSDIGYSAFSYCPELVELRLPAKALKCGSEIAGHCPKLRKLVMPEGVEDLHFTYWGCKALTELNIPKSVKIVGQQSIQDCDGLTEIVFPEGVREFRGNGIVMDCRNLRRIVLPSTLESIKGWNVFGKNPRLESIEVSSDNRFFTSVDGVLFSKDMTRLVQCPGGRTGVYEIPGTVSEIGPYAFSGCRDLTEIRIPESVHVFGPSAFNDCPAKTNRVTSSAGNAKVAGPPPELRRPSPSRPAPSNAGRSASGEVAWNVGKLPAGKLPEDGCIAWFDFSRGNEDRARPGRSFSCRNVPLENGALQFNGVYVHGIEGRANGCNAELDVPELDRNGFTTCLSFRPDRDEGNPLPLLNFGAANRWFYAHVAPDGRLRFGLNCHDIRLDTEGIVDNRTWNWFVCSLDIRRKTLRCVLNGVRLADVSLPSDFAWHETPERAKARVDTTYWNGGKAFKGEIGAFALFGRPFSETELRSLGSAVPSRPAAKSPAPSSGKPGSGTPNPHPGISGTGVPEFVIEYGILRGVKPNGEAEAVVPAETRVAYIDRIRNVRRIVLSEGIESIRRGGMDLDSRATLESVSIPKSVREIQPGVFNGSFRKLSSIEIAHGSPFSMDGGCLVDKRDGTLLFALPGRERIIVPNGVRAIADHALDGNGDVREVILPEGVRTIGRSAFAWCTALEFVAIPSSLREIGSDAFNHCRALSKLRIPDSVTAIGRGAFEDCPARTIRVHAIDLSTAPSRAADPPAAKDPGGLVAAEMPLLKFPREGLIAEFVFNDKNKARDLAKEGRTFKLRRAASGRPVELDSLVTNGALRLTGDYFGKEANITHLDVPELRYDRFTVATSFRPERDPEKSTPLVSFGGGWRWFHILLRGDGTPLVQFRGLAKGELSFPLSEPLRQDEWNWLAVSFDASRRRVSVVLNGKRIPDIVLPEDFAFRLDRQDRDRCRTVQFANTNNGTVFKGAIKSFLLFDRALTDAEIESIAVASTEPPTQWTFLPGEGEDAFWNGRVSDGSVRLPARVGNGAAAVGFPDRLDPPNGLLDLSKPVVDASGNTVPLVGLGQKEKRSPSANSGIPKGVTEVRLPETLRWIGPGAFQGFRSLRTLRIPASVKRIGAAAFADCPALERIEFEDASFKLDDRVFGIPRKGEKTRRPATNLPKE